MSIAFRFDDSNTERAKAAALAAIGVGQAEMAAREVASRGDASVGLTGIGSAGAPSQNPMQINAPLPSYTQPGVSNPPAVPPVPPQHLDAMQVTTKPTNYIQPNVITPQPNPSGSVSKSNPMGL